MTDSEFLAAMREADPPSPEWCRAVAGVDYEVHEHALGRLDPRTLEWERDNGEPYCIAIPMAAES